MTGTRAENGERGMKQLDASNSSVADTPAAATLHPPVRRPALEPVRARRRPLLVGLGLAFTALGGLGAVWLASSGTGTISVIGVAREVRAGEVIQRQDLVSVQIGTGSALRAVPVQRAGDVVGRRSLVRLLPGSLVNSDAVVDKLVPAQGQALVGLSLSPGQRPAVRMDAGDRVEIVHTPGSQESASAVATGTTPVLAVVVSTVDDPDTGKTVVNVSVPEAAA